MIGVPDETPSNPEDLSRWRSVVADPTIVDLFLRSTGNDRPPFVALPRGLLEGRLLPPTYLAALREDGEGLGIPSSGATRLNAENHYEWFARVSPGAQLERSSRILSTQEKRGRSGRLVFYKFETLFRFAGSTDLVAKSTNTTIRRYRED